MEVSKLVLSLQNGSKVYKNPPTKQVKQILGLVADGFKPVALTSSEPVRVPLPTNYYDYSMFLSKAKRV